MDPAEITLRFGFFGGGSGFLFARSNDPLIVQSLVVANSPFLEVSQEPGNFESFVRFAAGSALFGETTITISDGFNSLDVPVWLNDKPDIDPISDISILEDTPLVSIPLAGITAGGAADDPFNGGQHRLIYATSSNYFLTGVPTIQYDAGLMERTGTLRFSPVKGAPIAITNLGDNEATVTVTVEDAGVDNLIGKTYDPVTGDVIVTNFDDTLDNFTRTETFRVTIIPVNDVPTIDPINNGNDFEFNEDAANPLAVGVNLTQTTISLTDASLFPTTVPFAVQVDSEQMLVTAVAGNTFTVTRGIGGTVAAAHALGAIVYPSITLTGITPGGGSSPIGNEQQLVSIAPPGPQPVTDGFFTLTFDNGTHAYTTDLIPYDAPASVSRNETLSLSASANAGTFTLILANNKGAVTSLDTAINDSQTVFSVDDTIGFPASAPFVISVGNSLIGTLTSSITASDTTLTLTNATALPTAPFPIQIQQEQMLVTAVAGNTLTVTRGTNQTTAVAHDGSVSPLSVSLLIAEEMLVTDVIATPVTGNPNLKQLTVQRGYHGTTPAAHPDFASVIEVRTTNVNEPAGIPALPAPIPRLAADIDNQTTTFNVVNSGSFPAIQGNTFLTDALTAPVNPNDTVITLTDVTASQFATLTVPFQIQVLNELMVVTNVNVATNELTVVRAQDGTAPGAYIAGDQVVSTFTIRVDNEEMRVTGVSGNQLTVIRGVNGTSIAAHGNGLAAVFPAVAQVDAVINVVDAAMFPSLSPTLTSYDVRIDGEDLRVTFVLGNSLLVRRGIHGTAIAAHADQAQVSILQITAPISFDATAGQIQSALATLPLVGNTSNVQVLGGPISATQSVSIEFINQLGRMNLDDLTADITTLSGNETQTIQISASNFSGGGEFVLSFQGFGVAVSYDATAADIQTALESLPNINPGDVIVRGGPLPGTPITVEFTGQYANTDVPRLNTNSNATTLPVNSTGLQNNERQLIQILGNPTGGSFTLSYTEYAQPPLSGFNGTYSRAGSGTIRYDAADASGSSTAASIEAFLETLLGPGTANNNPPSLNDVLVTPVSQTSWIVEFVNVADFDHLPLAVNTNNLIPAAFSQIVITTLEEGNQAMTVPFGGITNGRRPTAPLFELISGSLSVNDALIGIQSITAADVRSTGGDLPGVPVTVEFTGAYAGLDIAPMTSNNLPSPTLGLADALGTPADAVVDANFGRRFDGEVQDLTILAVSDNPDVVPNPVVTYTSPNDVAAIQITNNPNQFGQATITVTVIDSGFDRKLSTLGDNGVTVKTFHVTVNPTNDLPTINPLPDLSIPKNSSPITLNLTGISTGGGESQDLKVTATSNNPGLLPDPSIVYTNGASTGTLTLEPIPGQTGSALIVVEVEDAGVDGILNTVGDNGKRRITFKFDVSEAPTLGATPPSIPLAEDDPLQVLNLTQVTAGAGESQPLRLEVSNTNTALFVAPAKLNVGSIAANSAPLNYEPTDQLSGSDVFRLTLTDGGPDNDLGTPGTLSADATSTTTLISVADVSIYTSNPGLPTDKLQLPVSLTDTTVTLTSVAAFPTPSPTNTFKLQINGEVMTVIGVAGNTFTVIRGEDGTTAAAHNPNDRAVLPFKIRIGSEILRVVGITGSNLTVVRGIDGTTPAAHQSLDSIVHPKAFDNLTITRDIPVVVAPVNDLPTLDVISPNPFAPGTLTIPEGSGQQIISLSGITDGEGAGARQRLRVEASSSNPALTGPITVVYTDGNSFGTIRFTPTANVFGTAGITVTVFDGGSDNNLNTLEADLSDRFSRTLNVTVVPIGDAPTINPIANRTINEDASLQTVSLTGISDGDANTQDLRVTATTTDANLISNLTLNYNPSNLQPSTGGTPPSTGSLTFVPGANRFGTASVTVTVMDGGADTRLGIDTLANSITASALDNAVIISNPTRFPTAAAVPFNIVIDNEEMTVTGITGNTFTVTRAVNGSPLEAHAAGALVTAPNTVADNVSTSRTFNVTVNSVNDNPTITTINGNSVTAVSSITLPAISEDEPLAANKTITLGGIGPGPFETQNVSVSVTSNNQALIPNSALTVNYVNGNSVGTITFQPVANKSGTATLTVKVMDAGQDGNLGTLSDNGVTLKNIVINVAAVNDAPTLDAIAAVTVNEESGEKTVNLTGITAGGGEPQILKVSSSVIASSIPSLITNLSTTYTSPNSTGTVKFTPAPGLFGTATIRVTVEDAGFDGVMSTTGDNATFFQDISVTVNNVNDLPTLDQPPTSTINKNGYLVNSVTITGISDGDLNTQTLTVTATSDNPALVPDPTVNFTQSGTSPSTALQSATLVFNPAPNQLGTANITVKVADGPTSFVTKTFLLTVVDVNLPPTIDPPTPNPVITVEDDLTPQTILLSGISAGGTESQMLKVTAVSSDPNAIVIDNGMDIVYSSPDSTGMVLINPQPNAAGNFTVTITVTDDGGDGIFGNSNDNSTSTTVDVQIAQGNDDAPTLNAIPDKVVGVSATPTQQTVNLSGIADGPYESGPVTVTIFDNDNPTLVQGLTVNYTSGSTGTLTFTPAANMSGEANIVVRVTDGGTNTFDRTFAVFVVNPPTLDDITNPASVAEDTPGTLSVPLTGISDGDAGSQGVEVSAVVLSDPSGIIGSLSTTFVNPTDSTGSVNYTLAADRNGTATIQVTVKDQGPNMGFSSGDEATITKTFTVVVTPQNDVPTLTVPTSLTLTEDGPTGTINLSNIFAKAGALLDEAGQPLRVTASSADTGKVTVSSVNYTSPNSTGSVVVAPVANAFGGPINVTITVEDGGTDNNLATSADNQTFSQVVPVSITAVNDTPTLNAIADVTVNEDSGVGSVNLSGITAGAGESQGLTVTATSDNQFLIPDSNLSVIYTSPDATGTLQFTPLDDASEDAFITVTVTDDNTVDGTPKSFSRTFRIRVNAVNDAPEIFGLLPTADSVVSPDGTTATIDENLPIGTEVAIVDFDDDTPLSSLSVSIIAGNTGNAFSITNDGTIKIANAAAINFESNPTFNLTVKITDNSPIAPTGQSVQQTFTINLNDLTEVLTIGSGNWPASGGLTLKRTGDGKIHVVNSSNVDVVPAHVFANVSKVQVSGRSGTADVLTVDYSGGDPIPVGATDGLTFDGGAGAGDTIKFANATFNELETTFNSSTSAAIADPDSILGSIGVLGVEGMTFDATVSATNLIFLYSFGADIVTFADDGNSSNGVSSFSANTSPMVTFPTTAGLTLNLGDGNNSVTFNSIENAAGPAVTVLSGDGNDSLRASSVDRAVSLSSDGGNDTLVGGSGADTLLGGDGDDLLSGGLGSDLLDGGNDTNTLYETADASFTVEAATIIGLGSDTFSNIDFAILTGGAGHNAISAAGFGGQVTINGAGGNDTLTGSSQNDTITGGDGNDLINGGGDDDTLVESGNVNLVLSAASMTGLGTDTITSIEFAMLTGGSGNNTLDASGFGGSVTLSGGAGNDILKGGDGDDSLSGDAGNDTLSGNGGSNTLNGGSETDQVFESADVDFTLDTQLVSSLGTDDLISIESAKLTGGSGNNTLDARGFAGRATLQGVDGDDTIIGGSNADALEGGNGNDVLTGGLGNDTFSGGSGTDTILEENVTTLSLTTTSISGRGTDSLASMEQASLTGTAGNDTISGGAFVGTITIEGFGGRDSLTGGNGADTILGGDGNDTLAGGKGNDVLRGEGDHDRITGGDGNDSLDGGDGNDTVSGQAGNDVMLGGEGNDSLTGGNDNDAIDGQGGDDKVFGENGNDTLIGGTGKDSILGGAGNDKLWSGDYQADSSDPADGDKDTLVSGTGTDTVTGETGLDVMTDSSNTSAEKAAAFVIDYDSIFGALLGP